MAQRRAWPASDRRRPLVAVGYGPRCISVMQLAEAAAGVCDLVWLVDASLAEMAEMGELLNRFGSVVDVAGRSAEQLAEALAPHGPDALVTYLDAGMVTYAELAMRLGVPFNSQGTAMALTDKFVQRQVLREAGLDVPDCRVLPRDASLAELGPVVAAAAWPAVLKPRSAQGSRYTFVADAEDELWGLLEALGSLRPDMVLETYLPDDPIRAGGPYAGYVSVESLVADGTASHLALTGRFPLAEHFRETGFFIPAALSPSDQDDVLHLAGAAIAALGVRTGCLHTEIKLTADGPRIIEVNGRVGGGVPEMLDRAAGIPLIELSLRLALGEVVRIEGPVPTERIGYRFFLQPPARSTTVAAIDGVDLVSDHPGVDSISVHQRPGSALDWRDGTRLHILAVVGSAADYDELHLVHRLIQQEVTVTYSDVGR